MDYPLFTSDDCFNWEIAPWELSNYWSNRSVHFYATGSLLWWLWWISSSGKVWRVTYSFSCDFKCELWRYGNISELWIYIFFEAFMLIYRQWLYYYCGTSLCWTQSTKMAEIFSTSRTHDYYSFYSCYRSASCIKEHAEHGQLWRFFQGLYSEYIIIGLSSYALFISQILSFTV